jgi:hypothetical protein
MIEIFFTNGNRARVRKADFAPVNLNAWENRDGTRLLDLLLDNGKTVVNLAAVSMIRTAKPIQEDDD